MSEPARMPRLSHVMVMLDPREAEALSLGLSDFLCWAEGFNAARAGTTMESTGPWGVEAVRTLNLKIKSAQDDFHRSQE